MNEKYFQTIANGLLMRINSCMESSIFSEVFMNKLGCNIGQDSETQKLAIQKLLGIFYEIHSIHLLLKNGKRLLKEPPVFFPKLELVEDYSGEAWRFIEALRVLLFNCRGRITEKTEYYIELQSFINQLAFEEYMRLGSREELYKHQLLLKEVEDSQVEDSDED